MTQHALTCLCQLALENSDGALKLKVTELATNRMPETLLAPAILDILESEPMLSVSFLFHFYSDSQIWLH